MQTFTRKTINNVTWIFFGSWLFAHSVAMAASDKELQERALKARESLNAVDHSAHNMAMDETGGFKGVFYGYLPCAEKDCDGLKMTLSLKQKDNYLLVYQYAKALTRENYEKGKYVWDEKNHKVILTPNKDAPKRQFAIKDEGTLIQLNPDGSTLSGDQDDYMLQRSDKTKSREVHIH